MVVGEHNQRSHNTCVTGSYCLLLDDGSLKPASIKALCRSCLLVHSSSTVSDTVTSASATLTATLFECKRQHLFSHSSTCITQSQLHPPSCPHECKCTDTLSASTTSRLRREHQKLQTSCSEAMLSTGQLVGIVLGALGCALSLLFLCLWGCALRSMADTVGQIQDGDAEVASETS